MRVVVCVRCFVFNCQPSISLTPRRFPLTSPFFRKSTPTISPLASRVTSSLLVPAVKRARVELGMDQYDKLMLELATIAVDAKTANNTSWSDTYRKRPLQYEQVCCRQQCVPCSRFAKEPLDSKLAVVHAAETQQFHGFLYVFGEVQRAYTIHSAGVNRSESTWRWNSSLFVASVIAVKETRHNIDNAGLITVAVDTLASSKLPKEQKIKLAGRVRSGLTIQ
jgi:hypothetical protein